MKLISWNVNGIRACINKGFKEFFQKANSDIFCIQETKCQKLLTFFLRSAILKMSKVFDI